METFYQNILGRTVLHRLDKTDSYQKYKIITIRCARDTEVYVTLQNLEHGNVVSTNIIYCRFVKGNLGKN